MRNQPQDSKQSQLDFARRLGVFAWICVAIIFLWSLSWMLIDVSIVSDELRGQFGDKFGAINSLFSGLAFATLIYALFLQMEELRLQRKELELTRDEMRGQKEEFSEQNRTLKQQRFENTFFQMLSKLDDALSMISMRVPSRDWIFGNAAVLRIVSYIKQDVVKDRNRMIADGGLRNGIMREIVQNAVGHNDGAVENYFEYLCVLMKFVHESEGVDKAFYAEIVRAQLSSQVRSLLYYYAAGKDDGELKLYAEQYGLLANFILSAKYCPSDCLLFFSERAYGGERPLYNAEAFQNG
ncbi:putative phage abortive infection protein [Micavibrio aeruginosavorus]|uniref:Phage abortive infection protein n=1 Tax=Micavibrio aeruginosavorus EPB TaxID=349215 RepID=M4VHV3_9BACT|nr:putative phage abortive infection protein [Micavibrio aeruginosavorus]AGH97626.1 hypothetical protein A11S_803 [Micavibrio aeruginosavorus EPB]